jgi:hypothetical protein
MRVAIITAGQPRFTQDFITILNQLKGFESADLYVNLWTSDWVNSVEQGSEKIKKILPEHIILKKLQITDQPTRQLPLTDIPNLNDLQWWYDRRIGQVHCLKLAFDLISEQYDIIVRVRPDGCLTSGDLDLSTLDLTNQDIIFCHTGVGVNQTAPNDQFFIGTQQGIKFLFELYNDFDKYMIKSCPEWTNDIHSWALEYIIKTYIESHGKTVCRGMFNHDINRLGRSAYTIDKHTHVPIAKDPTT